MSRKLLLLLSAAIVLAAGALADDAEVRVCVDPALVSLRTGSAPLLDYAYGDVPYKPCARRWHTPAGINILRDSPHDHVHHHALMYAVTVEDINFWEEHHEPGRQAHQAFTGVSTGQAAGHAAAQFTETLHWVNPRNGDHILTETRTIRAYVPDAGLDASFLVWESRLAVPASRASAELTGGHYHGLGLRFVQTMDGAGTFQYSAGEPGEVVRGDEYVTPGAWCALTGPIGEQTVTVAVFDHPDNSRQAHWFTMMEHFAYLSATLNTWKEPLVIKAGKPAVLRYGLALWDGEKGREDIEAMQAKWLDELSRDLKPQAE